MSGSRQGFSPFIAGAEAPKILKFLALNIIFYRQCSGEFRQAFLANLVLCSLTVFPNYMRTPYKVSYKEVSFIELVHL
jgi:hypothetical protein